MLHTQPRPTEMQETVFIVDDDEAVRIHQAVNDYVRDRRGDDDFLQVEMFSGLHLIDELILLIDEVVDNRTTNIALRRLKTPGRLDLPG